MSPRKRIRPNPAAEGSSTSLPPKIPSASGATSSTGPAAEASTVLGGPGRPSPSQPDSRGSNTGQAAASKRESKSVHKAQSWYGSWPRVPKSAASTLVARESILGGTSRPASSADLSRFDTRKNSDTASLKSSSESATAVPHVSADGAASKSTEMKPAQDAQDGTEDIIPEGNGAKIGSQTKVAEDDVEPAPQKVLPLAEVAERPATDSGWFRWLNRSTAQEATAISAAPESTTTEPPPKDAEVRLPEQPPEQPQPAIAAPEGERALESVKPTASGAPWFSFWANAAPSGSGERAEAGKEDSQTTKEPAEEPQEPQDVVMQDAPPASPPAAAKAGSTWAFWSRDARPESKGKASASLEQGELAVIGEGSEAHPTPASGVEVKDPPAKPSSGKDGQTKELSAKELKKRAKRNRPQSMEIDSPTPDRPSTPKSDQSGKAEPSKLPGSAKSQTATKAMAPNLLLPSFRSTYRMKENPSILHQITELLLRIQQPPASHVFLSKERPKIKRAVAIGVHGLFPATFLRPMIGQPTGTSLKFANHCAEGIRRWADSNDCGDCEIEKIALEGEGKIVERVENLWKLLLNWIDHLRKADLIVLACHSQGVPVGIMLVAKLIELGILTTPRVGVCAMAGVSLGPFPDYKSPLLLGSAAELWEFANPESEVSKRYEHSLKAVLEYGARITFVGSIDDQVVPMESAIYSPAHHPCIYRAVFIDGRIHAPDFIAHLVGFACKLRNLGISDHGLIRELSIPLAGSLYSGEGHSRLYDDGQVYDLAVAHALETTNAGSVPCEIQMYGGLVNPNPYHLPWIMRGLLEEDFVKTDLSSETEQLLKQFDDWKPATKALKDVKYRLEVVRSKL